MSTPSTSSGYLLDSSVLIEVLRRNVAVRQRIDSLQGTAYLSSVALGELNYGAKHSAYPMQNLADLAALTQSMTILAADATTADLYGDMRHDLATRGLLIPDNDIWIAATAAQYGLTLATRDAHFSRIAGLRAELWQAHLPDAGHELPGTMPVGEVQGREIAGSMHVARPRNDMERGAPSRRLASV